LGENSSIINISSAVTEWAPPHSSVYASSKSAVDTLTAVLAKELGPKKIRVNAIKPGVIVTEKIAASSDDVKISLNALASQIPLGHLGTTQDVAKLAVFLASDDSAYLSGDHISVSGGFNAT
jgi:3-oxoacyl-[acyl-carrier protein] reductase